MPKATKIVVVQLDVGQGNSTFVEIYRNTKKNPDNLVATALFDLGSERAKREAGDPSVEYIVNKLNSMTKPKIDFCSLSHSDSDHINLVQRLLSYFDPPNTTDPQKPILEVGKVVFGGPRRKFAKRNDPNVIDELERYQTGKTPKPGPLSANSCSFIRNTPMFKINEVEFFLLIGNHARGKDQNFDEHIKQNRWRMDSYSLNTYSLIFVVVYAGWQYVITGDATAATISEANYLIKKYNVTFANVAVLNMPHHASETTTFSLTGRGSRHLKNKQVPTVAKGVIETFSSNIKPMTIHSSAEQVGHFRHPSAYAMSYFWDHTSKNDWYADPVLEGNLHFYNAYFEKEDGYSIMLESNSEKLNDLLLSNNWYTFATNYGVFTSLYYVEEQLYSPGENKTAVVPPNPACLTDIKVKEGQNSPPLAVAWAYETVAADNRTSVDRLTNREDGKNVFQAERVFSFAKGDAPIERTDAVEAVPEPRRHGASSVDLSPLKPPSHRQTLAGRSLRRMRALHA